MAAKRTPTLQGFLSSLDPQTREAILRLREIVLSAHTELIEEIKWNAPSYSHQGEDRVTLGVERRGGVRVVLHRGAKVKDASGFLFEDPCGLASWPARDHGVVIFADEARIQSRREELSDLVKRWIEAASHPNEPGETD